MNDDVKKAMLFLLQEPLNSYVNKEAKTVCAAATR
jgi:hypothetical protein